jgi:hypothetical protein
VARTLLSASLVQMRCQRGHIGRATESLVIGHVRVEKFAALTRISALHIVSPVRRESEFNTEAGKKGQCALMHCSRPDSHHACYSRYFTSG